jgi:sterol desaturase/sphingolipid hydroxylase (fatty acid hydroxylase superfamily)
METYLNNQATLQLLLTAAILLFALAEALVLQRLRPGHFDWSQAWLSVGDLLGRQLLALLPLNIAAPLLAWAWQHRLFTLELNAWPQYLVLFLGLEFCYYWYHRASHRIRFFWATHAVHHSPTQLTLSTAFRIGWTGKLSGTALFFTPLVYLGFSPRMVFAALALNLLYQFWLHTTWIPRLGWLEYVFNTPSAHRVHHASNPAYLDMNFGGALVIFDRLFGTYVAEQQGTPCVYGLVTPIVTRNLFTLEFALWRALWRDLRRARSLLAAARLLVGPPNG